MNMVIAKQQGFSLVELLITMALGLLLSVGLIDLYISNQKTYHLTQTLARMQEDARAAMQIMRRDIRMAGYVGCGRLDEIVLHSVDEINKTRLVGWHDGRSTSSMRLPMTQQNLKPNSDMLLLQSAEPNTVAVTSTSNDKIQFAKKPDFETGDSLLISDCHKADIFRFNQPHFLEPYTAAEVSRWQKIIYYLAETERNNKNAKPIYALYRRDLNGPATAQSELIGGVEDLQVQYGEATSAGSYIRYVDAEHVQDWQAVRSVKIALLLVSDAAVHHTPQTYVLLGKTYQAADKRHYGVWQTTVMLREPML